MCKIDLREVYISAYRSFAERMCESVYSYPASLNWYKPESISGYWVVYFQMLDDFTRNLSNAISVFGYNIERLRGLHSVVMGIEEETRDQVLFEFVDDLFIVVMHTPHTMRDRFIFAGTQLSHMANRCLLGNWVDDLPEDHDIKFRHL